MNFTKDRKVTHHGVPMIIGEWIRPVTQNAWICNVAHRANDDLILHVPAVIDGKTWNALGSRALSVLKRSRVRMAKDQLVECYKLYRLTGEV